MVCNKVIFLFSYFDSYQIQIILENSDNIVKYHSKYKNFQELFDFDKKCQLNMTVLGTMTVVQKLAK